MEHSCHHPTHLVGVSPAHVVPMCASAFSSLWSIQLKCLVSPQSFGYLRWILGRFRRMLCHRCYLGGYFTTDVAPLLWILCRRSRFLLADTLSHRVWLMLCRHAIGCTCLSRCFVAIVISSRWCFATAASSPLLAAFALLFFLLHVQSVRLRRRALSLPHFILSLVLFVLSHYLYGSVTCAMVLP